MLKYFSDQATEFFNLKKNKELGAGPAFLCIPHTPVISRCIKCGATDVVTFYHKTSADTHNPRCGEGYFNSDYREHLHYCCNNCGYDWTGPTLDQQEEAQDVQTINSL